MRRYHFNIRDGSYQPDIDGTVLPTLGHARREAVRTAGQVLMIQPNTFWTGTEWFVEVTDDAGRLLFRVKFQAETVDLIEADQS